MARTYKHQIRYDYLHDNKIISGHKLHKLLNWIARINFSDCDLKIQYRKHKDFVRGGTARIKGKNYK